MTKWKCICDHPSLHNEEEIAFLQVERFLSEEASKNLIVKEDGEFCVELNCVNNAQIRLNGRKLCFRCVRLKVYVTQQEVYRNHPENSCSRNTMINSLEKVLIRCEEEWEKFCAENKLDTHHRDYVEEEEDLTDELPENKSSS